MIFGTRVMLQARTCKAISVATLFRRLILTCVAPMHDLIVPQGCSTVILRTAGCVGSWSGRSCTLSGTSSYSLRRMRRSVLLVQLSLMTQPAQMLDLQTLMALPSCGALNR